MTMAKTKKISKSNSYVARMWFVALLVCMSTITGQSLAQEIHFEETIAPIFESNCLHCHGEDEQEAGLRLDSRNSMLRGGDSGLATIVPGKPDKSYLMDVVNHVDEEMAMPPDEDKISQEEIDLLEKWIASGANWPGQMEVVAREKSDHWSFQPVVRPKVPSSESSPPNIAPIDAFLLETLSDKGLAFSQPADPRALIRRVSIVLTGLAPTPEEVADFISACDKDRDAAYASLIERLLASPHFGERWGQHWLDVIRWAETNGSESNMYRKNAWIYRDYVVRAFNEDKPYDQFLFEQIAGDTVGQGEATGYLVAGPHVPIATVGQEPTARRQARADRLDEVLQTVGASAMGMTIGCARCHNHKFDPISIKDYYSMTAVFEDIEYGSRFPELAADHPQKVREAEIRAEIESLRGQLAEFGPWEEHWSAYRDVHFAPVTTEEVRIQFLQKGCFVDELELFGPKNPEENFALASAGTTLDTDHEMIYNKNKGVSRVNDGNYGTESFAAKSLEGSAEKPWVILKFTQPREINRMKISSNREDFFDTDYLAKLNTGHVSNYRLEVKDANGKWQQVAATPQYNQLNKKNKGRNRLMAKMKTLIEQLYEEGPKLGFVARFVEPKKSYVLGRGSPENPRDEVFASGLEEIDGDLGLDASASGDQRRVAFAKWLTSKEHPLTARVIANRIWHHVFGKGIVTTTADFGAAGAPPTHPELLDWLAAELVEPSTSSESAAWSIKHLIRRMVMSQAFQQSSHPTEQALAIDGDSALLWRYPPKRVDAEVIRDSILQASDCLDKTLGGKGYRIHNVKKRYAQWEVVDNHSENTWRRMLYQERFRRVDDGMFTAFDFPDCGQVKAKRAVSTTPLQALNLMNSDFVVDQSKRIAERALADAGGDPELAVDRCFELLLGRPPGKEERKECVAMVIEKDLSLVCRALVNSNEFAFMP